MESRELLQNAVLTAVGESCYRTLEELRLDESLLDLGIDSLVITSIVGSLENLLHRKLHQDQVITLFEAETLGQLVQQVIRIAEDTSAVSSAPSCGVALP